MKNSPALSGGDRAGEFFNILEVIIHKILTVEESRGIIRIVIIEEIEVNFGK